MGVNGRHDTKLQTGHRRAAVMKGQATERIIRHRLMRVAEVHVFES